jgi:GTPase SAR1 family protein
MKDEWVLKICVTGGHQITMPFIRQHSEGKFSESYTPTIGVDVTVKRIMVDDQQFKFLLWNAASQPVFGRIRPMYFEGAFACIFPYEKSNRKSFEDIKKFHREFATNERKKAPCVIVGIITESEKITQTEGKELAQKLKAQYYEMTIEDAKTFTSIIIDIAKEYLRIEELTKRKQFLQLLRWLNILRRKKKKIQRNSEIKEENQ